MNELLNTYPVRHPETGIERIDGKLMAASPDDHLHVFVNDDETRNEVAERIVELASGQRSVKDIAAALCSEFEVDAERAERDVAGFVSRLVDAKVLVVRNAPGPTTE
jgi:pyrroloquinoline quinone biosynthesis protein D